LELRVAPPAAGFFLQPATGFGERSFDEASWSGLLKLSQYPQAQFFIPAGVQ